MRGRTGSMGLAWNRELKRLAASMLGIFGLGILLMNLCIGAYCNRVREEYYGFLSAVFDNVLESYPEVAEEELIQILNHQDKGGLGADILARYGILAENGSSWLGGQEGQLLWLLEGSNLFLVLFFGSMAVLCHSYFRKRQRRILSLTDYMKSLGRGCYKLELEDNGDDELSGLRNEIYKLTVFLREQADRALSQKRALSDAMTDISHQLKTPLTSMTVLVDILSTDILSTDILSSDTEHSMQKATRQRFITEISRQLAGMSWLITAMLKLSRLDAGVVALEADRINAAGFVREILQRLELAAEWRDISFVVDIPEEMTLYVDRKWTGEALMNIVKNAVEHSPVGERVEISGEENEVYTQIMVRDYGAGITEEEREKLFRRFYNGNSVREDSIGIGLSLAKEIIEKQDGLITVDSKEGEGTAFIIRFLKKSQSC